MRSNIYSVLKETFYDGCNFAADEFVLGILRSLLFLEMEYNRDSSLYKSILLVVLFIKVL